MQLDDLTEGDYIRVTVTDGRSHTGRFDGYRKAKDRSYLLELRVSSVGSGSFTFVPTSQIAEVERLSLWKKSSGW